MPKLDLKLKFRLETGPKLPKRVNVFSFLHFCKFPLGPPFKFSSKSTSNARYRPMRTFSKSRFFSKFSKNRFFAPKRGLFAPRKPCSIYLIFEPKELPNISLFLELSYKTFAQHKTPFGPKKHCQNHSRREKTPRKVLKNPKIDFSPF